MREHDRISDLPIDIKENILVRLPVKEAVRTCCLSSNWRLAWSSIPELVYDKNSISISDPCSDKNHIECTKKMEEFVDKFLSRHDGSICKFVIADVKPCPEALNGWIEVLLRKEIKEFHIMSNSICFNGWQVQPNFWNLQCLREVVLPDCIIKPPQAFKGFKLLKSLSLKLPHISDGDLTNLIKGCPRLENLVLSYPRPGMNISIDAPMLKQLCLTGYEFKHVCLRTPSLVKAVLRLKTNLLHPCESNLIDLLGSLPNLETLELGGRLTRYLTYGCEVKLPIKFYHLKSLHLTMNFACQREAAVVRQLFHHAPNLQELSVTEPYYAYANNPEEWAQFAVFHHLKLVKIKHFFKNYKSVFLFLTFLLASTPVLEEMYFEQEVEDPEFLEKLVRQKRASKKAKIYNSKLNLLTK